MSFASKLRSALGLGLGLTCLLLGPACDPEEPDEPGTTTMMSSGEGGEAGEGGVDECSPPLGDGWTCGSDEDCAFAGDCCGCYPYNPSMGSTGNCGGSCEQDKCEEWGIEAAVCRSGRCVLEAFSCNQDTVTCDAEPPACEEGFTPRVWEGCYVGDCLPIQDCDWAPGCDSCAPGQLCMQELRNGCDYARCVDAFPECGLEAPPCCTGMTYCPGSCAETADGFSCG